MEFLYTGKYNVNDTNSTNPFLLHAELALFADRMLMGDLKDIAIGFLAPMLAPTSRGPWCEEKIVQMVDSVYDITEDEYADGEVWPHDKLTLRDIVTKHCAKTLNGLLKSRAFVKVVKDHGELAHTLLLWQTMSCSSVTEEMRELNEIPRCEYVMC